MARTIKQIVKREQRIKLANEMLAWLQVKQITAGRHAYQEVVIPFATIKDINHFPGLYEVWQAWDILKDAGRRTDRPGCYWMVVSFTPISWDGNGDIVKEENVG